MTEKDRDEAFNILLGLSDRQLDPQAKDKLRLTLGKSNAEVRIELVGLIDLMVRYSWSSDFEIRALHFVREKIGGVEADFIDKTNLARRRAVEAEDGF